MKVTLGFLTLITIFILALSGSGCESDSDSSPGGGDAIGNFPAITPGGLQAEVITTSEGEMVLSMSCNPIQDAVAYVFTTSLGHTIGTPAPNAATVIDEAPGAGFSFSVYATNADGFNTRTASAGL